MIQRQLLDEPKQLQKTQQLNQQLSQEVKVLTQKVNTLSQKCIELEQQNIETLKRWREIEQSYKAMHEVFIDQVSGGG
jgi:phage shock protein A